MGEDLAPPTGREARDQPGEAGAGGATVAQALFAMTKSTA